MSWIEKRRIARALALSALAMVVLRLAGPIPSVAWAQSSSAPLLDAQHPKIGPMIGPMPAPVGHRQPRRKDLPPSVTEDRDDAPARKPAIDQSLIICRC